MLAGVPEGRLVHVTRADRLIPLHRAATQQGVELYVALLGSHLTVTVTAAVTAMAAPIVSAFLIHA